MSSYNSFFGNVRTEKGLFFGGQCTDAQALLTYHGEALLTRELVSCLSEAFCNSGQMLTITNKADDTGLSLESRDRCYVATFEVSRRFPLKAEQIRHSIPAS